MRPDQCKDRTAPWACVRIWRAGGGGGAVDRWRDACRGGADAFRRCASRHRSAGRRPDRMAARQAIGVLPRDVFDDPRGQVRWKCGLDAAFDLVRLRDLSCRGSRPRQGGDLVLSGRQSGNRAARHRALLCFRHVAVAGGRPDRRDRGVAAQRHRQDHVRGGEGDCDRELRVDCGIRGAAGLDQGRQLYARIAGKPADARIARCHAPRSRRPRASHDDQASRSRP